MAYEDNTKINANASNKKTLKRDKKEQREKQERAAVLSRTLKAHLQSRTKLVWKAETALSSLLSSLSFTFWTRNEGSELMPTNATFNLCPETRAKHNHEIMSLKTGERVMSSRFNNPPASLLTASVAHLKIHFWSFQALGNLKMLLKICYIFYILLLFYYSMESNSCKLFPC